MFVQISKIWESSSVWMNPFSFFFYDATTLGGQRITHKYTESRPCVGGHLGMCLKEFWGAAKEADLLIWKGLAKPNTN